MVLTLSEFNEIFANKDVNDSYVIGKCLELRKEKKITSQSLFKNCMNGNLE